VKSALCIAAVLVGAMVPAGCSSMDAALAPDFASKGITSVAVVHVVGELKGEAGINQVADMFAMEFMRKGYKVVERQQAVAVLKEQAGKLPAASYDAQAVFVGKLLGVDGVIVVNIPKFDRSMNLTAKMLDVKDGGVLWISYGTAETGETGSTIAGAVIGGVAERCSAAAGTRASWAAWRAALWAASSETPCRRRRQINSRSSSARCATPCRDRDAGVASAAAEAKGSRGHVSSNESLRFCSGEHVAQAAWHRTFD